MIWCTTIGWYLLQVYRDPKSVWGGDGLVRITEGWLRIATRWPIDARLRILSLAQLLFVFAAILFLLFLFDVKFTRPAP